MEDQPLRTPDEVVADNARDYRNLARLSQGEVAARMERLGFPWKQQTVSYVEGASRARELSVSELWGLSWVLEVTIADLLDPSGPDGRRASAMHLLGAVGRGPTVDGSKPVDSWQVTHEDAVALAWSRDHVSWEADPTGETAGKPGRMARENVR